MAVTTNSPFTEVSLQRIFRTWWPLAFSWLLMTVEIPMFSAVITRLANPEINLAAFGGMVYPMALIIESPIVMLLSASTALSRDWASYRKLYKFMMIAGASMTLIHILIAFTPIYYFVARQLIGLPESVVEPGRLGLMWITPWTWSIAYRRFQQGVLIRYGYSNAVGIGTIVRLAADVITMMAGYAIGSIPGVAVASIAQAAGVVTEAVYAGLRVQPVVKNEVRLQPPAEPLTWKGFAVFYVPLALTSLLGLIWQSLGSAALSRMPDPLISLAVWPVASGLVGMFRSFGFALNEVVVALIGITGSFRNLRRFVLILAGSVTGLYGLVLITPAAQIWFGPISGLRQDLSGYAQMALLIALPLAGLTVFQSWFQGSIVNEGRTRAIPEATFIFLSVFLISAIWGIVRGQGLGLYIVMAAFIAANLAQTGWLFFRSRKVIARVQRRDEA